MRLVSILAPGVLPEICIEPLGSLRAPSSRASTRQPPAEPLEREPRAGHERTGAARVQPAIGRTSASLPSADREPDVPIAVTSAWGRRQPRSTSPHEQTAFTAYLMSMNFSAQRTLHSAASLFSAGLTVVPFSAIVVAAPITTVTAGMPMRMGGSHFDSTQWLRHFGTNCYHEHGSSGLLGTHNVTFAEHELTSDDDIFARCYEQFSTRCAAGARTSECGAIVVPASPHDRTRHKPSLRAHECWLHRGPLVLVNCRRDRRFTTYVASGAAESHAGGGSHGGGSKLNTSYPAPAQPDSNSSSSSSSSSSSAALPGYHGGSHTQLAVWEHIASTSDGSDDDYHLIVEDDVSRHPALRPGLVIPALSQAARLAAAADHPFFYVGVCDLPASWRNHQLIYERVTQLDAQPFDEEDRGGSGGGGGSDSSTPSDGSSRSRSSDGGSSGSGSSSGGAVTRNIPPPMVLARVAGSCAHAYAVRRRTIRSMINLARSCLPGCVAMDQVLTRIAATLGGVYVPGINLTAPSGPRAFGLYYQDRKLFPSVTTSKVELRMRRCDRECKPGKIRHWLGKEAVSLDSRANGAAMP